MLDPLGPGTADGLVPDHAVEPNTDGVAATEVTEGDETGTAGESAKTVQFATIHGYERAYRMIGSGPPLLLLHGIGDNSKSWLPVMTALARRHTVVAPDLLGHGESDKPRADYSVAAYANGMRDLLEVLGIDRVTVVGHSLGGGVAAQFAYQYPERCERLVLVSTGGVSRDVSVLLRVASAPFAEISAPFLHLPITRVGAWAGVQALKWLGHDLGRDAQEFLRVINALPTGDARIAFTRTLRSVVDWRGQVVTMLDRSYLAEAMPILLMWGDHDAVIPPEHAYLAQAAMPGSRLEIYPGAGHFPHHHDPERFVKDLERFIDTSDPAAHDRDHWRTLLRQGPERRPQSTIDLSDGPLIIE